MEPLNSDFADSKTDIISLETIDCRTPSPVTSEAGSVRTVEISAIETDGSVDSSSSALQLHLQNLPPSTQTLNLSDRAVLSRDFSEDREFYLHLQDLKNSIEEQSEENLSKTGYSKIDDFVSNRQHHSQTSNARARRRERLSAGLPMSHLSSSMQVISPSLSSPERLADLIHADFTEEINQISSTNEDRHGFDDPLVRLMRENASVAASGSSVRHDFPKRNLEDCKMDDNAQALISSRSSHLDSNYILSMDHSTNRIVSPETDDTVAPIGLGYAYMTQKRTPIKFGGYRPAPGLIFRNLSSESESDTAADQVIGRKVLKPQHGYAVQSLSGVQSSSNRMEQVEPFDMKNVEFNERRRLSPVISVDSRLFCDESKSVEEIERTSEIENVKTGWVTETPNGAEKCTNNSATHLKNTPSHENNSVESLERRNHVSISKSSMNSSSSSLALDQKSLQISKKHSTTLLPTIPPLEIDSQGQSQSQSLTSEERDDRAKESLDVNALIQALSNVSLKQESKKDQMSIEQKSPFRFPGNRFSGSSGPRSSEYTPAMGGSRQSLTSLEVSDAHSLKTFMAESKTQRTSASPLLKLNAQSARSIPRTLKVLENLSRPRSSISKYQMTNLAPVDGQASEVDLLRSSSFIPVVAKINRTNLVCPKYPSKIKAIGKLLSPRKYPKTEVSRPLSSRTDVSYLSEASRKSFRSLKSAPLGPITRSKKRSDCTSQPTTKGICPSAPIFGRKILEPLNLVPTLRRDCPMELNKTFERRKKTVNDLLEVNNGYLRARRNGPRAMIPDQSSCEETPPLRDAQGHILRSTHRPKKTNPRKKQVVHNGNGSPTTHNCVLHSNGGQTPGEDSQKVKNSKYSEVSSGKLLETPDNVSYFQLGDSVEPVTEFVRSPYRSKGPSMSSEEHTDWYPPSENELPTLHIQGKKCKLFSQEDSICSDIPATTSPDSRSLNHCVYLNDLQNGREVTLLCGNSNVEKKGVKKIELFESLPNEISASLTRHEALEIQAAGNLSYTKQLPTTIEDLERNIQENNDQWVKNFKSDEEKRSLKDADEISAIGSPMRFNVYSSPQKSVESVSVRSYVSSTVEPQSSAGSSPLYKGVEINYECISMPCQPDSQRSSLFCTSPYSQPNTSRSPAASNNSTLHLPTAPCQEVDVQNVTECAPHLPCRIGEKRPENTNMESISDDEDVALQTMLPWGCPYKLIETRGDESESERISKSSVIVMETEPTLEYSQLQNSHDSGEGCEQEEQWSAEVFDCKMHVQLENEEANPISSHTSADDVAHQNPKKNDEKERFLSSDRSAKSGEASPGRFDAVTYSPMPVRSFSSMAKLNSSAEPKSKWNVTVVTAPNSGRKSQERFPFTISESTSIKTSKFKVVEAVCSKQLTFYDQNTQTEANDLVGTQSAILVESGHPEKVTDHLKPFLDGLTDWKTSVSPPYGLNYTSYGYQLEGPRNLFPSVKGMVKRFSSKLRCSKQKQFSNPKKNMIEILYKNKNCHCESIGGGSSSVTSSNESQMTAPLAQASKDDPRTSSVEKIFTPKRNPEHVKLSLGNASKLCDQDDLWIQEFDSDEEFHVGKTEASIPSQSPHVDDGYSMFMARCKFPGIDTKGGRERVETDAAAMVYFEGGDTKKVVSKVADGDIEPFIKVQDMVTEPTKAPTNFWKDADSELGLNSRDNECQDYAAKNGCCCFRICRLFQNFSKRDIASKNHNFKERRRTELRKKK